MCVLYNLLRPLKTLHQPPIFCMYIVLRTSPKPTTPTIPRSSSKIIGVDQIDPFIDQQFPEGVSSGDGPGGEIPVAHGHALGVCRGDLGAETGELGVVQEVVGVGLVADDGANLDGEAGASDGRGVIGEVGGAGGRGAGRVEQAQGRVVKVIAFRGRFDLRERGVACADDGDGSLHDEGRWIAAAVGSEVIRFSAGVYKGIMGHW